MLFTSRVPSRSNMLAIVSFYTIHFMLTQARSRCKGRTALIEVSGVLEVKALARNEHLDSNLRTCCARYNFEIRSGTDRTSWSANVLQFDVHFNGTPPQPHLLCYLAEDTVSQ